jgi:hypothetical protein
MKSTGLRSLALFLLVSPFLLASRTDAAAVSAIRVDTITHGVKLSLSIPRQTYPKDALVTVTVRLQNVSRHTLLVLGNNPSTVSVFDSSHQAVYWPRTPFMDRSFAHLSGPRHPPIKLRPRKQLVTSYFVILRGPLLQAQATVGPQGKEHDIQGPMLSLTLTDEAPPTVTVMETPTLHATITPASADSGPLYFVEQAVGGRPRRRMT